MSKEKVRKILSDCTDVSNLQDSETVFLTGIDSMQIGRFLECLATKYNVKMSFVNFFENSSISEITNYINMNS